MMRCFAILVWQHISIVETQGFCTMVPYISRLHSGSSRFFCKLLYSTSERGRIKSQLLDQEPENQIENHISLWEIAMI